MIPDGLSCKKRGGFGNAALRVYEYDLTVDLESHIERKLRRDITVTRMRESTLEICQRLKVKGGQNDITGVAIMVQNMRFLFSLGC